jgi:L-alanine-DL-glutamate epimerase-like enolase superfamily enzyme
MNDPFPRRGFLGGLVTLGGAGWLGARASTAAASAEASPCGPLPIESVRVTLGDSPCTVRLSSGPIARYPFGLVRIRAGGCEGIGEGHIKDLKPLVEAVRGLPGQDARRLDHLLPAGAAGAVGEAISTALHDLVAKVLGVPFHQLLGGALRREVAVMPCIFADDPAAAGERAAAFAAQGFGAVKFKFFGKPDEDLAVLKAVRAATPAGRTVQADANFGYRDTAVMRALLTRFADAGLDIAEDPLESAPQDPYRDYPSLRGRTSARLMLDIGVRKEGALAKALLAGCGDLVNLHPNQQGSITRALHRAITAETLGVPVWMGGTGSFGVHAAAWQQLAACIRTPLPCGEIGGLFDHGFADDIVEAPYPLANGVVSVPDAPGLGIHLDEDAVKRMSLADETFIRGR